MNEKEAVPE